MNDHEIYHTPSANVKSYNRTLCAVLEEMRKAYETCNFSYLPGLIEEVQTYANRMEAKLEDVRDYENIKKKYKDLLKKKKELEDVV